MNTRGASKTDSMRAYATLGWGSRADVQAEHCLVEERHKSLYLKDIDAIKKFNTGNPYNVSIGLLGNYFHSINRTTSMIGSTGSSGVQNQYISPGAFVAADSSGMIDSGIVGNEILWYDSKIHEYRTDFNALLNAFKQEYANNDFIVVDTRDTSIYEQYRSSGSLLLEKESVLSDVDRFIGNIATQIDSNNTLLMVLSPHYSTEDAKYGRKLCPIVFYGQDIESGLLISDTTRRAGIVANIDIAPTIIRFFGGIPKDVTGEAINVKETVQPLKKAFNLYRITAFNSLNRGIVLKTYIAFQIFLLVIILIFVLISVTGVRFSKSKQDIQEGQKSIIRIGNKPYSEELLYKVNAALRLMVLFVLICPTALFLMPLTGVSSLFAYILGLILINMIFTFLICRITPNQEIRIITICLLTSICIVADLLMNGPLNKTSLLGYDAVIGARYYGLGNEYLGVLLATSLMSIIPLVQKKKISAWIAVLFLIMILPVIGLTMFGANVGGTIAATMAFGFATLSFLKRRITFGKILLLFAAVISVVGLFAAYDILWAPQKSHLARALIDFKHRGIDIIFNIIRRKLEMNLKLLRWTIWSKVLLVSVAVIGILFLKPRGMLYTLINKYKSFSSAWYAILVGSVVGMMVNDSGVVVAATSNIFLIFSLLYFLLGEEQFGIRSIRKNRT
jgi:hypothetical protein